MLIGKQLIRSKKFWVALVGLLLVVLQQAGVPLEDGALEQIVQVIMAYLVGQGLADFGKEAPSKETV